MAKKTGYIVTYQNAKNESKKGHVYHDEQTPQFRNQNQLVIREVDEDGNHVKLNGREVVVIKDRLLVTQIGFVN